MMKQNFIPFTGASQKHAALRRFGTAPKISHRRLRNFQNVAYRSDADNEEKETDTPEQKQEKKVRRMLVAEIRAELAADLEKRGFLSATDIQTRIAAEVAEANKHLKDLKPDELRAAIAAGTANTTALEVQGRELADLKKKLTDGAMPTKKDIKTAIRAYLEANKEQWDAFRQKRSQSFGNGEDGGAGIALPTELQQRAAITMTVGASTQSSAFLPGVEVAPGFVDLARNQPFLENYANTSSTSSSRIVWANKKNPQGNAAFIGEGITKPLISFELGTEISYAKKVADKIKVSSEMLQDIDFIADEIEKELKYKVDMAVDASLLAGAGDGTGSATDVKGLTTYIGGYILATVNTTTPNNFDAVRAAIAQVVSLNYNPNIVFINTIDGANMDLVKDTQGRTLRTQYMDAGGKLFRMTVVETNQIPVGYFLLGDMSMFVVKNYIPFSIAYGWVNDDFEKNMVTIIGERRLHAYISSNNTAAFVYDTFANVKTAITAA